MEALTTRQARDGMYTTFKAAWDDALVGWRSVVPALSQEPHVRYENVRQEETKEVSPADPWLWLSVMHNNSQMTAFGDTSPLYEASGIFIVQIFTPLSGSLTLNDDLVNVIKRAFKGKRGAGDFCNIVFRGVRINEVEAGDRWYQTNVLIEFEYDEA